MESSLRKCFATQARLKTAFLTFVCISSLLFLYHVGWEDLQKKFNDVQIAAGSAAEAAIGVIGTSHEQATSGKNESTAVSSAASTTIPSPTPTPVDPSKLPAIVAAAMRPDDVAWMEDMTENYEIFPYIVTDRNPNRLLKAPKNKGREAMVYLTYLIDEYDNLPPYAIFIHGHRTAWHQSIDIEKMIGDLRVEALQEVGYVSFRCKWKPSCPAELRPIEHDAVVWGDGTNTMETEYAIGNAWPSLFPDIDLPHTFASPCCAQFAVTRDSMLRRTKDDYIRMRKWLLETELNDQVSGRVFEKLWAYLFTGESMHCPSQDTCACTYFGSCGIHLWENPPEGMRALEASEKSGHDDNH